MRAVVIERHGGPEVLRLQEVAPPRLESDDDIIIRVEACALNRLDIFARCGIEGPGIRGFSLPHVSGVDVAGTVESAGAAAPWEPGRRVLLYPGLFCGACEFCADGEESMCRRYRIFGEDTWGGLAELTKAPSRNVFEIPEGIGFVEAAAFPVAFTTAWRMLVTVGRLRDGESVLVLGAGGGVGSAAVRIALLRGSRVFAVSRGRERLAKLSSLGVHRVVDRDSEDFREIVAGETDNGVDLVANPVGGETWRPAVRSLKPGGRLVLCGATIGDAPQISIREIYQFHRRVLGAPLGSVSDFREALGELAAGRLAADIDGVYPLEQTIEAQRRLESGDAFGKVIVRVGGSR